MFKTFVKRINNMEHFESPKSTSALEINPSDIVPPSSGRGRVLPCKLLPW